MPRGEAAAKRQYRPPEPKATGSNPVSRVAVSPRRESVSPGGVAGRSGADGALGRPAGGAPERLTIRVKRTREGFEALARGAGPAFEVLSVGATAARAVSECMAGVAAFLAAGGSQ